MYRLSTGTMKVAVFQRGHSADHIVEGLKKYGDVDVITISVDEFLPQIIDEPSEYIDENFEAELIIDHMHHGDLTDYLIEIAREKNIPIIVPNKKVKGAITPPVCCSLNLRDFKFGHPEFRVKVKDGRIWEIDVLKGSPCGATWVAAEKIKGMKVEEAIPRIALEVQYLCKAKGGYSISKKKAPLHVAGDVHSNALKKALRK
jgi:hypothetical protein